MFKQIENLPENVLGIEASGKLTHTYDTDHLIPVCDCMLDRYGTMKFLYVIGEDFDGFELAALWDDATYGVKHWSDVSHIALVTDESWMVTMLGMFAPFFPGETKVFSLSDRTKATEWIISVGEEKELKVSAA